ncbi:RecB-family nuclease [Thermogladius sp. 4427co]|uniref:RecB-family nuclease n=1 Tax=Thermogladius sp. 4427co TaxID=3450718 RepID=UPI003F791331
MGVIYIGLYGPTSVQKLLDFTRIVYSIPSLAPVVIKPVGAAAQIGVPDAFKLSLKLGRPFIVVPELGDALELLKPLEAYYYSEEGEELDESSLGEKASGNLLFVFPSGENEPGKKELTGFKLFKLKRIPPGMPSIGVLAIFVYKMFYQTT